MLHTLRIFSSKCCLFHNATFFGSCVIHILYTECAKIKKKNSGAKGLTRTTSFYAVTKHENLINDGIFLGGLSLKYEGE